MSAITEERKRAVAGLRLSLMDLSQDERHALWEEAVATGEDPTQGLFSVQAIVNERLARAVNRLADRLGVEGV